MFIGLGNLPSSQFDNQGNADCPNIAEYPTFVRRLKRKVSLAMDPFQREYLGVKYIKPTCVAGETKKMTDVNPVTLYWKQDEFRRNEDYGKKEVFRFHFKTEMCNLPPNNAISTKIKLKMRVLSDGPGRSSRVPDAAPDAPVDTGTPAAERSFPLGPRTPASAYI